MLQEGKMKVPDFVRDLVEIGAAKLSGSLPVSHDAARQLMLEVAHDFCDLHGKRMLYVPAFSQLQKSQRNAKIWEQYSTVNDQFPDSRPYTSERAHALAGRYGVSLQWVYAICRMYRQAQQARPAAGAVKGEE